MPDIIFKHEIDFYLKKGKWKKCLCTIQINQRVENTLCAIINDYESSSIVEKIDIFGYECGINNTEFIFIGRGDCYSIRFADLNTMMDLGSILKKYIKDVSYFIQFEACSKSDCILIPKNWYRFHVQNNRICLTVDHKIKEVIKAWNISRIGKTTLIDYYLSIEINSGNDCGVYTFYRDSKKALDDIYNALNQRKSELRIILPVSKIDPSNLVKRKSEISNLKRLNSCSNPNSIKPINRIRASSSSETYSSDYNSSMPSTPYGNNSSSPNYLNINEDAEHSLVFQMDSLYCGSTDSNVSEVDNRKKSNSEGNSSLSTESSQSKSYMILERFPFEAENKLKMDASISSTLKSSNSQSDNMSIVSRPTNGKCYQSLSSIKNQHKTSSYVNLNENTQLPETENNTFNSSEKKDESDNLIFMNYDNGYSSSSFIHTPSPLSNTSIEHQSMPVPKCMSHTLSAHHPLMHKQGGHSFPNHNYYNLSYHITTPVSNSTNHKYYNLSNQIESHPIDFKHLCEEEEKKLNYATLDFGDFYSPGASKLLSNNESDSNYKQIDIGNTEALKALDEYSYPKTQKKGIFKYFFKNK